MLKAFFGLPLRALEGFINSIFQLMDMPLTSPDYSSISKRAQTVNVKYRLPSKGAVTHLVIDASGLKVFGEGEWKQRKYDKDKRRVWRKLHLAVDARTHEVIAAEVSLENVADNEVLPTLLNPLRRQLHQVSALTILGNAINSCPKKAAKRPSHRAKMRATGKRDIRETTP